MKPFHIPITRFGRLIGVGMLCAVILVTSACSNIGARTRAMFGDRLEIKVKIAPDANMDNPVAVDLLLVYDDALLERLIAMTALEWFNQREQIRKDNLPEEGLDTFEWEWIPGQTVADIDLPLKPSAKAAILFVRYLTPGPHRFRIDPFSDFTIRFEASEVFIESL